MRISAKISSSLNHQETTVQTNDSAKTLTLPIKPSGFGSAVNGAELLSLALATCYCNDIYREATKMNIQVSAVKVQCEADFGAEGEPGNNFTYNVRISANASDEQIKHLMEATDKVAEIHNTLRAGRNVTLVNNE